MSTMKGLGAMSGVVAACLAGRPAFRQGRHFIGDSLILFMSSMSSMSSGVAIRLIAIAIWFPLLVSRHTLPLTTFYGEFASLASFGLLLLAVPWLTPRARGIALGRQAGDLPLVLLVFVCFMAVIVGQWASGLENLSGSRFLSAGALLLGGGVAWLGYRCHQASEGRPALADALATAFLMAALFGTLAQWIQVFDLEGDTLGLVSNFFPTENRRIWGNLNQPNHQATVEGMGLAAAVWLAARGRLGAAWWLVAVAILESGIVLSGSRTGLLHVGTAVVFALLMAWFARDMNKMAWGGASSAPMRRPVGLLFAAVVLIALLPLMQVAVKSAGTAFGWSLYDAVARLQEGDQVSYRGAMWAHALAMFDTHRWLGVGWGEFGWHQFRQLEEVGLKVEMSLHAHNAVFDLLAKTGIVGTAGAGLLLLAWLWRVCVHRLWRASTQTRTETLLGLTWLAMLGAHSMLEYPLHYLYFLLPVCFLLGWMEPGGFGRLRIGRGMAATLSFVFAVVAAGVLVTMWQDYRAVEAREYAASDKRDALPQPRIWFRQHAAAADAEHAVLTPENARQWLAPHIAAVHLLPAPTMIARTAWLMALTGDETGAQEWMSRLRFYYFGDELNQLSMLVRECDKVAAEARPDAFCRWVRAHDRLPALRQG